MKGSCLCGGFEVDYGGWANGRSGRHGYVETDAMERENGGTTGRRREKRRLRRAPLVKFVRQLTPSPLLRYAPDNGFRKP